MGFWTILIASFWAVSGIYFGWPRQVFQFVNSISPVITARPPAISVTPGNSAAEPDLRSLVQRAYAIDPGTTLDGIAFPYGRRASLGILMRRGKSVGREYVDTVYFNPYSGEYISTWRYGGEQKPGRLDHLVASPVALRHVLGVGRQAGLGCRRTGHPAASRNGTADVLEPSAAQKVEDAAESQSSRRCGLAGFSQPCSFSRNVYDRLIGNKAHWEQYYGKNELGQPRHRDDDSPLHESEGPRDRRSAGDYRGRWGFLSAVKTARCILKGSPGCGASAWDFSERRLAEAAYRQMLKLPFYHTFAHKATDIGIELAEKLLSIAPVPMAKVFFVNSGSEANDTVVKLVWYYNNALGRPRKKKIISRAKAYHGVTVASASLTGLANNHRDFDLPIDKILHVECPHYYRFGLPNETEEAFASRMAESLEQRILSEGPDTVAAFIAEPIMGAGGVLLPPVTYWEKIQAVLEKYDVLLIADEVICGFGRTGEMWGTVTYGLKPRHDHLCQGAVVRLSSDRRA